MNSNATSPSQPGLAVSPVAYPLDEFYTQAGRVLPVIEAIEDRAVPEPYQSLLVHTNDMTPTLESFHGRQLHLRVLHRQLREDFYFREVVLVLDETEVAVEFGAIKINLSLFPPPARREILEEREPLGHILAHHKVAHACRPKAFLRIQDRKSTRLNSSH